MAQDKRLAEQRESGGRPRREPREASSRKK
jgi:hypothetical protein